MPRTEEDKRRARTFVKKLRDDTVCEECGGQPIEWHNDQHEKKQWRRIARMAARGVSNRALAEEISNCRALCRRCHMKIDGRLGAARRTYTDVEVKRWHRWYCKYRVSVRQVGIEFGVHPATVAARFRQLGLEFEARPRNQHSRRAV